MDRERARRLLEPPTTTVPIAGEILGLCRRTSYDAAARGDIPTIKVGKRLLVPTELLRQMLGLNQQAA